MNHRKILEFICDEGGAIIVREPYQITAGKQIYELATDGRRLLAFLVERSDLPEPPARIPEVETVKQRIADWLTAPATHTASAAAFADFLNLAECAKCPCCKGGGKREPDISNIEKYGIDDRFTYYRYVKINGYPFNANLIARTLVLLDLSHLAGGNSIRIETRPDGDGAALILYGGRWTLIVMSLSIERTANESFDDEWELDAIE